MLDNSQVASAKELLKEAFKWKQRQEQATSKFNELKRKLGEILGSDSNVKELSVDDFIDGSVITAKISERVTSLKYNADSLKKSLSPEQFNEVVQKTYVITDIDKMVSLLKNAGVKPSEFKSLLHVEVEPMKSAIQQLYSVGDITAEQLKGCYTATISKSVLINCKNKREGDSD